MSEDEVIEVIEELQCEYREQENEKKYNDYTVFKARRYSKGLEGLLDLYQKQKEINKDLWKAYLDVSNDIDNNYIEKDKVKELFYKKRGLIEREDLQELLKGNNNENTD
jgi:hypothetical protein